MRLRRQLAVLLLGAALLGGLPGLRALDEIKPGTRLESLTVGPTTYRQVQVRSINARSLVFTHAGGLASVRLRDLSPEWQTRLHYQAAADHEVEPAPGIAPAPAPAKSRAAVAPSPKETPFDALLRRFGQPAAVQAEVDLRPKFFQLELGVKNQGRRPSCAIFSIVSALEFQNAELTGRAEKFSEEYLTWAVRLTVQRLPAPGAGSDAANPDDRDEGFTLPEVVAALRAYGIPLQTSMPNTFGRKIDAIEEPPAPIIEEARNHQRVFVHQLPGRDNATRINNVVQALNAGVPVAVGMAWPNYRSLRTGYLSGQKPMEGAGHAVTLVGYRSATGRLEDTVFIFKNSWGANWGQGGYGTVTYNYLHHYLNDAVLLEVQGN